MQVAEGGPDAKRTNAGALRASTGNPIWRRMDRVDRFHSTFNDSWLP